MANLRYTLDMPTNWISRTFEGVLGAPAPQLAQFPVWLVLGPRQVGKSSLLKRLGPERRLINLDDLNQRQRANENPELFFRDYEPPLIIDEIQYAPDLLSPVKRLADASPDKAGLVWITGSQNFQVMSGVKETLAGRVGILNLLGLTDEEKGLSIADSPGLFFNSMLQTNMPKMFGVDDLETKDLYVSSYLETFIERDIRELHQIEKRREFETFVKVCALRTGQIVNYDEISKEVGVSAVTVKSWLSLLEDSFLIKLIHPYYPNRNKRLIKSPKLYFLDTGLAANIAGWKVLESVQYGPASGALFETHVFSNIYRYFKHRARTAEIYFWRTRDGEEVDFIVEAAGKVFPIEVKKGKVQTNELFPTSKISEPNWEKARVLSLQHDSKKPATLNSEWMLQHCLDLSFFD